MAEESNGKVSEEQLKVARDKAGAASRELECMTTGCRTINAIRVATGQILDHIGITDTHRDQAIVAINMADRAWLDRFDELRDKSIAAWAECRKLQEQVDDGTCRTCDAIAVWNKPSTATDPQPFTECPRIVLGVIPSDESCKEWHRNGG